MTKSVKVDRAVGAAVGEGTQNPGNFALASYGRAITYLSRSYLSYLDALTTPYGISSAHVPLLAYLAEGNSGETQNEIARALGVDKGTISRNVQALLKLGLVTQQECSRDSRACTVELTPEGRRLAEPISKISDEWAAAVAGHLSETERSGILGELQSMIARSDALVKGAQAARDGLAAAEAIAAAPVPVAETVRDD